MAGVWTPLSIAVHNGNFKTTQMLVSAGADVNFGNPTPLFRAVEGVHEEVIIKYLLENGAGDVPSIVKSYPMCNAVLCRDVQVVKLLLEYGVPPMFPLDSCQYDLPENYIPPINLAIGENFIEVYLLVK